jgi:hypothetical protein
MKELKSKHFKYHWDLVKWVNETENCEIVSICGTDRFSEGFILFYF